MFGVSMMIVPAGSWVLVVHDLAAEAGPSLPRLAPSGSTWVCGTVAATGGRFGRTACRIDWRKPAVVVAAKKRGVLIRDGVALERRMVFMTHPLLAIRRGKPGNGSKFLICFEGAREPVSARPEKPDLAGKSSGFARGLVPGRRAMVRLPFGPPHHEGWGGTRDPALRAACQPTTASGTASVEAK